MDTEGSTRYSKGARGLIALPATRLRKTALTALTGRSLSGIWSTGSAETEALLRHVETSACIARVVWLLDMLDGTLLLPRISLVRAGFNTHGDRDGGSA